MPDLRRARVGELELGYETFGRADDPPVLLITGLGAQMLGWPDGFCADLADRGMRVVRFDNRDVGLSTHLTDAGPADLGALFAGDGSAAVYGLEALAADAIGLLDAMGLDSAHLVGASMGGMIAQLAAIEHPARVRSLTSMRSTTGDRSVGTATPAAMAALLTPPALDRETHIERAVRVWRVLGSTAFAFDEAMVRERAGRAFDRSHDPDGFSRQLAAVLIAQDRTPRLRSLDVPALVIHGDADPLVDVSGGRATAAAIPGAELLIIEGMGHDLPEGAWLPIADAIAALVARAEAGQPPGRTRGSHAGTAAR